MFDPASLILASIFGLFGLAYFVYGKRETEIWFLIAGALLMLYPFFISGTLAIAVVGLVLTAAPFLARWFGLEGE